MVKELKNCYNENDVYYYCDWKVEKEKIKEEVKEDILKGNIDDIVQNYIA